MFRLRPSASAKWTQCAASSRFEAAMTAEPDSDEAREGTCAAWVVEQVLLGDAATAEDMDGETHPNGWVVTPDMIEHCQGYIQLVRARSGQIWAEREVRLNEFIGGRLDVMATVSHNGVMFVDDFKFGYMLVEVERNTQLLIYAGGAYRMDPNRDKINSIQLGIYQPRGFHPDGIYRTWTITPQELMEWVAWIEQQGHAALQPNSPATPGAHCQNGRCKAAAGCAALAATLYAQGHKVSNPSHRQMTPSELSAELTFLTEYEKMFKARKSAVETEAEERMKGNKEFIPGWALQPRYGNRKLTVDAATVKLFTNIDATKSQLKTPAELEREGVPVVIMETMSKTPVIGYKLKPLSKRQIEKQFKKD